MKPMNRRWKRIDRLGALALAGALPAAVLLPFLPGSAAGHERLVLTAFGIGVYLATFTLCSLLFARALQTRHAQTFGRSWLDVWGWIWRWHGMVAAGLLGGALAGALLYTVGGFLFGFEGTAAGFARRGAADGAFYLLIWCPGLALVWCFAQAFGPKQKRSETGKELP